jgi:hypothetical protein
VVLIHADAIEAEAGGVFEFVEVLIVDLMALHGIE